MPLLRLRVAESLPWVDSAARVRSSLDGFRLLAPSAREAIHTHGWSSVAWEFGVLCDQADTPDVKAILFDDDDITASPAAGFPVGYRHARQYQSTLRPLWTDYLTWFSQEFGAPTYFLSDEVWQDDTGWMELSDGVKRGLFGDAHFAVRETTRRGWVSSKLTSDIRSLLQHWWPSSLGGLAGVVVRSDATATIDRVRQSGVITAAELPDVVTAFETTPVFDQLGFVAMCTTRTWPDIQGALRRQGWHDGRVVASDAA